MTTPMTKILPNSSLMGGRNQNMLQQPPNGASGPLGDTDYNLTSMVVTIPDVISSVRDFMPNKHHGMQKKEHQGPSAPS